MIKKLEDGAKMDELYEKLLNVMSDEKKVYDDLLALSAKKTDVVINLDVKELDNIVKAEQTLILSLRPIEDKREKCVEDLKEKFDLLSDNITMEQVIGYAGSVMKKKLSDMKDSFNKTIGEQQRLNKLNTKLIRNNLDYINLSVNLLVGADETAETYGAYGINTGKTQTLNLFDKKI